MSAWLFLGPVSGVIGRALRGAYLADAKRVGDQDRVRCGEALDLLK